MQAHVYSDVGGVCVVCVCGGVVGVSARSTFFLHSALSHGVGFWGSGHLREGGVQDVGLSA